MQNNSANAILFLGNVNSPLIRSLALELKKQNPNIAIDILSETIQHVVHEPRIFRQIIALPEGKFFRQIPGVKLLWLMFQFGRALQKIKGNYAAVHMLFLHVGYSPWINRIQKLSPRFIVSVFGSDFYQSPPIIRILLKRIVKKVDLFTAANPKTRADFIQFYGIKEDRMRLCRFGLSPLDSINKLSGITREQAKEQLGFPPKSQVVVCGYNASPLQQHEELIASLRNMAQPYRENVLFVFPIASNAGQERKEKLKNLLAQSNLQFKTIDHFLNDEDLAKLRIAADVMIQVQKTDQLSGSMQEHVFAGSMVITGHWLPYAIFDENGIYLRKVNSVSECGSVLTETLDHLADFQSKIAANREKIWALSSWKSNIENWLSLYET